MLANIVVLLAVLVVALLGYAATRPDQFMVERSTVINTPSDRLFGIVGDLANFDAWSPWSRLDPDMTKTFGATTSGVGGSYGWDGNNNVGSGRMEIVEFKPDRLVRMKLEFFRPFKATNEAVFRLAPEGEGTRMVWTMTGPVPYFAKIMHLFMNMDRMVGGQFEEGLANLKALAETDPGGDLPGIVV